MFEVQPIGYIKSPFKQKFAIPRQPGLAPRALATLEFTDQFADDHALRELDQFSHLWLLFWFHGTADRGWHPTVQPPRLGGRTRVGVFASRSPFRPNPIGLSVVANLGHHLERGRPRLRLGGVDLLDGTPVLDIKPYLPYADQIDPATAGFASASPARHLSVEFSDAARLSLQELVGEYPDLEQLIVEVLSLDPRPAWRVQPEDAKQYGMTLYDINIKWQVQCDHVRVLALTRDGPGTGHAS